MNTTLLDRLDRTAEAIEAFGERHKVILLGVFSLAYFSTTGFLAVRKPMWNDELFTWYISQLPTLPDIWSALLTGGEQIPPFYHLITRISLSLFGPSEFAVRLPQVFGFWVMTLCLFRFVNLRAGALYGFVAMLFPVVTKAYEYAYEARPYAMVLGFAGLSLLCWQSATAGRYRILSLIGLAASVAAAVSNHYYAVLILFPLAVGEVTRSISVRRTDPAIWVMLGAGLIPLLLFLPLIQESLKQASIFWARPYWRSIFDLYYTLLSPTLNSLLVVLVLSALYSTAQPIAASSRDKPNSSPPFYEIAAAMGFIAIPVVVFLLAVFFTGAIYHRYVLSSIIGFSVLVAFAPRTLAYGRAVACVALVISLCGDFVIAQIQNFRTINGAASSAARTYGLLQSDSEKQLPIVASDLNTFTTLSHYAPPEIAARLVYLADPEASLRRLNHSSVDQGILDLKPWFRLRVQEYRPYIASQSRFLVYGKTDPNWVWLLAELMADNYRIEMRGRNKFDFLFLVSARD